MTNDWTNDYLLLSQRTGMSLGSRLRVRIKNVGHAKIMSPCRVDELLVKLQRTPFKYADIGDPI